ncbi:hypothetical protein CGI77_00420 [Vibrio parahaemolyticus]|nr:hypothetical protein UF29_08945 [Vibrio parahaemolyticus]TOH62176.1 hypothetical protein CGI77_00420 [Vibrio parahaemolyticus]
MFRMKNLWLSGNDHILAWYAYRYECIKDIGQLKLLVYLVLKHTLQRIRINLSNSVFINCWLMKDSSLSIGRASLLR